MSGDSETEAMVGLPEPFTGWFGKRGWQPRAQQLELLEMAQSGLSCLLIAPTGAGKTLAGFLPSLVDLTREKPKRRPGAARALSRRGVHTLYVSPPKALAVDIERNLAKPVEEMALPLRIETRTGDTPQHKRQRQKRDPPDILLTTPEQIALLIASREAETLFAGLRFVIFDELHSLVTSKRGHLLSLGLARLRKHRPALQTIGLSATVTEPEALQAWLMPQAPEGKPRLSERIQVRGGAKPQIRILETDEHVPWSGHSARYAWRTSMTPSATTRRRCCLSTTRSQAELLFQELWRINEDNLPIALHHGSLDASQRRKVEAAMADNRLRAVVATSTLDPGIDWGDVDLVVHIGTPKGASRLAQRIGRSNHRMDEPSQALLVPANRFEVMECRAVLDANYLGHQDTPLIGAGTYDVLAQHVLGMACAAPFEADDLFAEVTSAAPYVFLERSQFDRVLDFVTTGGYALKTYDRYARIRLTKDGTWRVSNPQTAQQYRLNIGTIIEMPELMVRLTRHSGRGTNVRGGPILGKIEGIFVEMLSPGDTSLFAGKVLRLEGIRENKGIVSKGGSVNPKIPTYAGGKFPLTTYLADQVRSILAEPERWRVLPDQVRMA